MDNIRPIKYIGSSSYRSADVFKSILFKVQCSYLPIKKVLIINFALNIGVKVALVRYIEIEFFLEKFTLDVVRDTNFVYWIFWNFLKKIFFKRPSEIKMKI